MFPRMSYDDYIKQNRLEDSRSSWILWKIEIYDMEPAEATKAAYDPEYWGEETGELPYECLCLKGDA